MKTSKISQDVIKVVLDSLEDELNKIVVYKQRLGQVGGNEDIKKVLDQTEKDAEKNAAQLTRLVEKFSDVVS